MGLYAKSLTGSIRRTLSAAPRTSSRRHLWQIVGAFVPGGLIADRTAIENAPAADGSIFLIADRFRPISLPGITIKPRKGPHWPLESDQPFIDGLRLSSTARAYLENMAVSGARQTSRAHSQSNRTGRPARHGAPPRGKAALNKLRDDARAIAPALHLEDSFGQLDKLIGALLGTQGDKGCNPVGARVMRAYHDPQRLSLFDALREIARHASGHAPRTGALARTKDNAGLLQILLF